MHRTTAVTFAAVLLIGSISAGFAQGTGRGSVGGAGTPGIGTAPGIGSVGGAGTPGIGTAPSIGTGGSAGTPGVGTAPGIGTGGSAGTPGVGTGKAAGTPGVGSGGSTNPSDTLPGMPAGNQSDNQSGISPAIGLAIGWGPLPATCLRLVRPRMRISRPNTWKPCPTNRALRT
jgi:hypothetical protein